LQVSTTGCGDFPNQVNNSVCFPGILKGTLLVRAEILEAALTKAIGQGRR
jgi:malate dehydrogenase (oxaloacetate-decarboxylating)